MNTFRVTLTSADGWQDESVRVAADLNTATADAEREYHFPKLQHQGDILVVEQLS